MRLEYMSRHERKSGGEKVRESGRDEIYRNPPFLSYSLTS